MYGMIGRNKQYNQQSDKARAVKFDITRKLKYAMSRIKSYLKNKKPIKYKQTKLNFRK